MKRKKINLSPVTEAKNSFYTVLNASTIYEIKLIQLPLQALKEE